MKYEVKKIIDRSEWNDFVIRNDGSFLQSFEWGEFQKSLGRKIWRIRDMDIQALITQYKLPLGKGYLYCPRGPIVRKYSNSWRSNLQDIIVRLKEVRPPEIKNTIFLRIDPEWEDSEENKKVLQALGFQRAPKEIQPKITLILDITKPEKELLAQMHPKTRYNIHLAQRHGIKIQMPRLRQGFGGQTKSKIQNKLEIKNSNNEKPFEEFWRLLKETAKRDKFRSHPKEYYKKMLNIFSNFQFPISNFQLSLFLAKYQEKIIAANIVIFFGKRATYLHGASDYNYRNLMAPYLLQWEQIREAKKNGYTEYDFWGIDPKKWSGLTKFKKGFGGKEINFIGAWDFVFQPSWYKIYQIYHKLR